MHLRFGTISHPPAGAHRARLGSSRATQALHTWLNELIWRDFYFQILYHHPHVVSARFKPEYDAIAWEQGDSAERCSRPGATAHTGYPLVDAADAPAQPDGLHAQPPAHGGGQFPVPRTWGSTGAGASTILPQHLNDFDLAANNGGWQWAASSGCDAQPYFRIFNPVTPIEKFDPAGADSSAATCRNSLG